MDEIVDDDDEEDDFLFVYCRCLLSERREMKATQLRTLGGVFGHGCHGYAADDSHGWSLVIAVVVIVVGYTDKHSYVVGVVVGRGNHPG